MAVEALGKLKMQYTNKALRVFATARPLLEF